MSDETSRAATLLMRAQMQAEWELAHAGGATPPCAAGAAGATPNPSNPTTPNPSNRWPPWIEDRDPPAPGFYLLRVAFDEAPMAVRFERWDGSRWITKGGYARAAGWLPLPPA